MKKLLLILPLILFTTLPTFARYDFESDNIYYNILSSEDQTCEVTYRDTNYRSYSGDIVIPSTITYNGKTYSVTTIGNSAFYWCTSLTSITLPNSVTTIGNYAFYRCTSLTSITLPNSLTTIGKGAFRDCNSLTSITLPNSLTTIGDFAFWNCSRLTEIISLAVTPPSINNYNTFYNVPTSTCTLKVPAESVEAYKAAEVWKDFDNIIPLTEEELQALPVESITATPTLTAPTYNLRGQQVGTTHKGIVIRNRHKVILK